MLYFENRRRGWAGKSQDIDRTAGKIVLAVLEKPGFDLACQQCGSVDFLPGSL
jgi:hypothetical protein